MNPTGVSPRVALQRFARSKPEGDHLRYIDWKEKVENYIKLSEMSPKAATLFLIRLGII